MKMLRSVAGVIILLAVATLLAFQCAKWSKEGSEQIKEVLVPVDSVTKLVQLIDSQAVLLVEKDAELRNAEQVLEVRGIAAKEQVKSASRATDVAVQEAKSALPDSIKWVMDSLQSKIDAERAAHEKQVDVLMRELLVRDARIALRDSTLARMQENTAAIAALNSRIGQELRQIQHPSRKQQLVQLSGKIAWGLTGYGLGKLL